MRLFMALVLPVCILQCAGLTARADESPQADEQPRVVSINLCTDQLLMLLAEPEQILALSSLSHDKAGSYYYQEAKSLKRIDPIAEDIFPLNPDVIITGPYTSRYTLNMLDELGLRVETIPIANTIEQMLDNVVRVGDIVDQVERARRVVDDVRTRLSDIAVRAVGGATNGDADVKPRIAIYDANGYTVGRETVRGEAIELSGWTNVATEQGIDSYGVLGLEQLIGLKPQALVESPYSGDTYSRGQMLAKHPAIAASGLDPLIIKVPSNMTICAGPWTVDVIDQLVEARKSL